MVGKTVQGEIQAVTNILCDLKDGHGPEAYEVAKYSPFFMSCVNKFEHFHVIPIGDAPLGARCKQRSGRKALEYQLSTVQEDFDKAGVVFVDFLAPLRTYAWLLTPDEMDFVNRMYQVGLKDRSKFVSTIPKSLKDDAEANVPGGSKRETSQISSGVLALTPLSMLSKGKPKSKVSAASASSSSKAGLQKSTSNDDSSKSGVLRFFFPAEECLGQLIESLGELRLI